MTNSPNDSSKHPQTEGHAQAAAPSITVLFQVLTVVLVILSCVIFAPFAPALTLAAWFAGGTRSWLDRLGRALRGRTRAAAVLTVSLFVTLVGPMMLLVVSLVLEARGLAMQLAKSGSGRRALEVLMSTSNGRWSLDWRNVQSILKDHGDQAIQVVGGVASATTSVALGVFVFFSAAYVMLVDGPKAFGWFVKNTPIADKHLRRLASAFHETGRGLFVGVVVTGLIQATVATIAYAVLSVPRALLLGAITLVASLIPSVGTALVWFPVVLGLWMTGRTKAAVAMLLVGMLVISTVDNLLRPFLARRANLDLHGFVVMLSMLGGLEVMGGWGLMFGPLMARLALESLRIVREEKHRLRSEKEHMVENVNG